MSCFRLIQWPRLWVRAVCLTVLFMASVGQLMADGPNDAVARFKEQFDAARIRFQENTNNVEAAWQFARACFDLADLATNNTQRAEFAERGINPCRIALAQSTNSAPVHYYLGMNIGQLADTKRNLSGLRMVKEMEREFLAARALDEHFDYGGPDRNLGLLYREAPVVVSIGSRTKARAHLERAVELAPDFPENHLNLIEAYLKWGYKNEAARQLKELEKMWPEAQKKFTGAGWVLSWANWNKRLNSIKGKLEDGKPTESPRSAE